MQSNLGKGNVRHWNQPITKKLPLNDIAKNCYIKHATQLTFTFRNCRFPTISFTFDFWNRIKLVNTHTTAARRSRWWTPSRPSPCRPPAGTRPARSGWPAQAQKQPRTGRWASYFPNTRDEQKKPRVRIEQIGSKLMMMMIFVWLTLNTPTTRMTLAMIQAAPSMSIGMPEKRKLYPAGRWQKK